MCLKIDKTLSGMGFMTGDVPSPRVSAIMQLKTQKCPQMSVCTRAHTHTYTHTPSHTHTKNHYFQVTVFRPTVRLILAGLKGIG